MMQRSLLLLALVMMGLTVPLAAAQASVAATPSGFSTVWMPKVVGGAELDSVAATGPNSAWAVGGDRSGTGFILHWNGKSWARQTVTGVPLGPLGTPAGQFVTVAAISSTNAWVAGYVGLSGDDEQALVAHWNGTSWKAVMPPAPVNSQLGSISVVKSNDIWAFGTAWAGQFPTQIVEHWNGTSWTLAQNFNQADPALIGIALPGDQLWTAAAAQRPMMFYDGKTWQPFSSGGCSVCAYYGFARSPQGDLWAVGGNVACGEGTLAPCFATLSHWTGSAWQEYDIGPYPTYHFLRGVTAISSSNVWAVGYRDKDIYGAVAGRRTLIVHWNGTSWTDLGGPNVGSNGNNLLAVTHVPGTASEMWAVGYHDSQPLILHHP